jgi:hypothetical protein
VNRRGFLGVLLGAAALPLVPVLPARPPAPVKFDPFGARTFRGYGSGVDFHRGVDEFDGLDGPRWIIHPKAYQKLLTLRTS